MIPFNPPSKRLLNYLRTSISPSAQYQTIRHHHCRHQPSAVLTHRYLYEQQSRRIHTSSPHLSNQASPDRDRPPAPGAEPPPTDFAAQDMLSMAPPPASSIDACTSTGFNLSNGLTIREAGLLLVNGEAFTWLPWLGMPAPISSPPAASSSTKTTTTTTTSKGPRFLNSKYQFVLPAINPCSSSPSSSSSTSASSFDPLSLLRHLYPRPDIIIIGTGPSTFPLAPETRERLADLGIRAEVADTRNAAAQWNLLATERGVGEVAGAMLPIGWVEGRGLVR